MQRPSSIVPALVGLALTPLASANGQVVEQAFPAHVQVLHDVTPDGALVAAGTSYKALADKGGFTFVPFLGSDAPRNFPVRFTVDAVHTNGARLAIERDGVVTRDGDVLRITRTGVEARYTLSPRFVEQAFVIAAPGESEVRVSLAVESDLALVESVDTLAFEGPFGGVTYGAATAFSPDGRSCAVDAIPTPRGFDLVVPAWFVASCDGELLIDPIIGSGTVAGPGSQWTEVASDVGADEDLGYLIAIEREFSATDHDIFLYRRSASTTSVVGTLIGSYDISVEDVRQPSVAGRNSGNEYLVVARAGTSPATRINGRVVDGDGWTLSSAFDLSSSSRANAPDVGSDRAGNFFFRPSWFVVWEEEPSLGNRNIRGRQVSEGASLGPLATFAGSAVDEFWPKLGETAGSSTEFTDVRYTLAYRRDATNGTDLVVQQFDRSGTTVEGPSTILTQLLAASHDVSGPSDHVVSNGERAYLIVLESRALIGSARFLQALVCGGDELLATTSISEMSGEEIGERQMNAAVACEGDQWLIAYEELAENATQSNVLLCTGDLAGDRFGLAERRQSLGVTPVPEVSPAIASLWEGGSTGETFGVAFATWTRDSGPGETRGAQVQAYPSLVCGVQYCEPNDNSTFRPAWIAAYGTTNTSTLKRIACRNLPPFSATYVLVSRESAFVANVGGGAGNLCLGGNGFGRFSNAVAPASSSGAYDLIVDPTMIAQPNGTVAAVAGETWYFQGWFRDLQGGMVTSNLTNGVAVTFE